MVNTGGPERRGRRALSPSRAQILDLVRRNRRGVTLPALVRFTGLHENTVRGHLEALLADDLLDRTPGEPSGRGRPPWVWVPRSEEPDSGYAGLASALAAALAGSAADAPRLALEAGRSWGRDIGRTDDGEVAGGGDRGAGDGEVAGTGTTDPGDLADPDEPAEQVVRLMRRLDYEPEREPGSPVIALRACPLLDAAVDHPQVVCAVHHGLVRGALEAQGHADVTTELEPFASPGTCLLRVGG